MEYVTSISNTSSSQQLTYVFFPQRNLILWNIFKKNLIISENKTHNVNKGDAVRRESADSKISYTESASGVSQVLFQVNFRI